MESQRIQAVLLQLQGFLFPRSPGPGQSRIEIPVEKQWVKWFLLRCTDFQQKQFEGEDRGWQLGVLATEPLGEGGPGLQYFLLGDETFALMPYMVKPYSRKQLTREERIAIYRISRGRRVVENAFGILVSRFRVLLVVRHIMFTCVVLHTMLRTYQGGADRTNTSK